jgi:signal transduction histidine kinase
MEAAEADVFNTHNQLIAIVAHELRYPLVPIRRAAEMLRHEVVDAATVERAVAIIERQTNGMNRLIGDLVDAARMQRGAVELRRARTALSDLLECVAECAAPLVDERGHDFTMSGPDEPVYLPMDVLRINQALLNIIANATRYTDRHGHIALRAWRERDRAVIVVSDTGIGIPPHDLESIFGLFVKSSQGLRIEPGLGIGLYLARHLIEAHGGTVTATSAGVGHGSEFTVRLLCEPATG